MAYSAASFSILKISPWKLGLAIRDLSVIYHGGDRVPESVDNKNVAHNCLLNSVEQAATRETETILAGAIYLLIFHMIRILR